jgi:hypothetical protein
VTEYVFGLLAGCVALAVVCALFGDQKRADRGLAVLRELLCIFRNSNDEGEE